MSIKIKRIEALRVFTDVLARLDELFAAANIQGNDIEVAVGNSTSHDEVLEFDKTPLDICVVVKYTAVQNVATLQISSYTRDGSRYSQKYEQPTTPPDEDTRAYNAMCVARLLFKELIGKEAA